MVEFINMLTSPLAKGCKQTTTQDQNLAFGSVAAVVEPRENLRSKFEMRLYQRM